MRSFGMAGTCHETAAAELDVPFLGEFFPDLTYAPDGSLIPRQQPALDLEVVEQRMTRALPAGELVATDGTVRKVEFQTVRIHSDPPNARDVAATVRRVIDAHF